MQAGQRTGLFWSDQEDAADWATAAGKHLDYCLGPVFGGGFRVELKLPDAEVAKGKVASNLDLLGELVVTRKNSPNPLRLEIALPYRGVFVKRSRNSTVPRFAVWAGWLGERAGFRYLRKMKDGGEIDFWRLGLPGGDYVQAPCKKLTKKGSSILPNWLLVLPPRDVWSQFLEEVHLQQGPVVVPSKAAKGKVVKHHVFWEKFHKLATKNCESSRIADEDDLKHRTLVTFPVWLKARLAEAIIGDLLRSSNEDAVRAVFNNKPLTDSNIALKEELWESLIRKADWIAGRLFPEGWEHDWAPEAQNRFAPLQWVAPENPVDMAALLTQVQRYQMRREALKRLPAKYRQNHPSFRGCICPVQTPESELVGLSLQLARGAQVNWDGEITPAKGDPHDELGFAASLIPFYEHNDGARCMMGAKNLLQAVPVAKRSQPVVRTGGEKAIVDLVQPLVTIGICPNGSDAGGNLSLGADLLVAYLPWHGMNVDDAIVVGQHVVDAGLLDIEERQGIRKTSKPGWEPVISGSKASSLLFGEDQIAQCRLERPKEPLVYKLRYTDRSPAILKTIESPTRPAAWMGGVLEYELVKNFKLGLGDKLMGRHGNKGVIGAIVPSNRMPRLPQDDSLPAGLRGRPIDVLLNPHGVISRMNLGQLLETHIGWLLHAGFKQEEFTCKVIPSGTGIGQPFLGAVDHKKVPELLEKSGLDRFGRIRLLLPDGGQTLSPVVVGFQHIVRLRHVPEQKAQARRGGSKAQYSPETGQAAHGRNQGGGQRVGEMEVWALAGHQAEHVLEEMLGTKADSILASQLGKPPVPNPDGKLEGFGARLRDCLFALLMDLQVGRSSIKLGFVEPGGVEKRVGAGKKLKSADCFHEMIRASFSCNSKSKKGCQFVLLGGDRISAEAHQESNAVPTLQVGNLLEHLGLTIDDTVRKTGKNYHVALRSMRDGRPAGRLRIKFDPQKDQLKAEIEPDNDDASKNWPKQLGRVCAYGRFYHKEGKNADAALVLAEFQKEGGEWQLGEMQVTCSEGHQTIPLKGDPPYEEIQPRPIPGGLFDRTLFGDLNAAGKCDDSSHWAYIELPTEISYPLDAFFDGDNKRLNQFVKKYGIDLQTLPRIKAIPVLPVRYRMPHFHISPPEQDDLVDRGYIPILRACNKFADATKDAARKKAVKNIEESVRELFRMLVGQLERKEGLIRRDGLGRRVDRSGRLVITPNPKLRWDEVGIPTAVLVELLGDELVKWAEEKRSSKDLAEMLPVLTAGKSVLSLLKHWSWRRSKADEESLGHVHKLLRQFLKDRPEILVILNRQPSLHRDNMQAFHPVPLPPEDGDVIQLCPLACRGFGADFDGDEMAVHIPVSTEARKEASRLLPSNNMLSLANAEILAQYQQDFVLGLYWLSREEAGFGDELSKVLPFPCCRDLISGKVLVKTEGAALLKHLAEKHPDAAPNVIWQLSDLAFKCCSRVGASFGFYDVRRLSESCSKKVNELFEARVRESPIEVNERLQKIVKESMRQRLDGKVAFETSGLHLAAMAISGARGEKQVRQLVGARGFLDPGFETSDEKFKIRASLVGGMDPESAFYAAMNSRSSMCDKQLVTGQSGYLTRRLVFALWPIHIVQDDCGNSVEKRGVLSCKTKDGLCSACYGRLPDGSMPEVGFPAGLIAAQSVGERGTQLSMQSFHTGQKSVSIQEVVRIIDDKDENHFFETAEDATRFVQAMREFDAYRGLHERHLQILWRAIHQSSEHSLASATESAGWVTRVSFEEQAKQLLRWAFSGEPSSLNEPSSRVLFNLFGSCRSNEEAKP